MAPRYELTFQQKGSPRVIKFDDKVAAIEFGIHLEKNPSEFQYVELWAIQDTRHNITEALHLGIIPTD